MKKNPPCSSCGSTRRSIIIFSPKVGQDNPPLCSMCFSTTNYESMMTMKLTKKRKKKSK